MHQKVDLAEFVLCGLEDRIEIIVAGDVAGDDELRPQRIDQFANLLLVLGPGGVFVGQMSEAHLGSLGRQFFGDGPRDRAVVGDAEHDPLLAFQQSHVVCSDELKASVPRRVTTHHIAPRAVLQSDKVEWENERGDSGRSGLLRQSSAPIMRAP